MQSSYSVGSSNTFFRPRDYSDRLLEGEISGKSGAVGGPGDQLKRYPAVIGDTPHSPKRALQSGSMDDTLASS